MAPRPFLLPRKSISRFLFFSSPPCFCVVLKSGKPYEKSTGAKKRRQQNQPFGDSKVSAAPSLESTWTRGLNSHPAQSLPGWRRPSGPSRRPTAWRPTGMTRWPPTRRRRPGNLGDRSPGGFFFGGGTQNGCVCVLSLLFFFGGGKYFLKWMQCLGLVGSWSFQHGLLGFFVGGFLLKPPNKCGVASKTRFPFKPTPKGVLYNKRQARIPFGFGLAGLLFFGWIRCEATI